MPNAPCPSFVDVQQSINGSEAIALKLTDLKNCLQSNLPLKLFHST
ncbi:MAG: hypothetical protein V7K68_05745 [Nostoc sp.]